MFKEGDRIRCINNSTHLLGISTGSLEYRQGLSLTDIYIVTKVNTRESNITIKKEGNLKEHRYWVPMSAFVFVGSPKIQIKVGDYVLLPSSLPEYWSEDMSHFLGKIVKITKIYQIVETDYFEFEGSKPYFFDSYSIIKSYTEAEYLQYLEFKKESPQSINDVYELAKEIYPENRVELDKNSIIIYFPHIHITNADRKNHDIYDLFFKIAVNFDTNKNSVNLGIEGKRMSYTLDELQSGYCHSHLQFNGCQWSSFCLGSSQFYIIKSNMAQNQGNTNMNWKLLFYSISRYLEWESLEGGPYRYIRDIKSYDEGNNISFDFSKCKHIFKELPLDLIDATSAGVSLTNMTGLTDFVKQKSPIKSLKKDSSERAKELTRSYNDNYGSAYINFKGKKFPFKVIEQEVHIKEQNEVTSDVVAIYKSHVILTQNNFNKELNSNYAKDKFRDKLFGKAGII